MPKILPPEIDDRILTAISANPEGVTLTDLVRRLEKHLSRRSLQRRLAELINKKLIASSGATKTQKYRIAPVEVTIVESLQPKDTVDATVERYVPLSKEGEEVRNLVRLPITLRTPVGYARDFLSAYEPNKTYYLPDSMRRKLQDLGSTRLSKRPAGTYARDIMNRLLIDLSWASSNLEGNTYTRLDTQQLIEHGTAPEGKDARETQMILNHKQAIEFLIESAEDIGFNTFTFFNLHALLSENLLADPSASGRIRTRIVDISGTTYHPLAIPQQVEELFRLLLEKAGGIENPFEQAFFLLVHIPYLQPFEDVNKRVSRLGANIPFFKANLCPLSFIDVPERAYVEGTLGVYELRRIELLRDMFFWAYERSCQRYQVVVDMLPEPDPFRLKYREALRETVATIVRNKFPINAKSINRISGALVPIADQPEFARIAQEDLEQLHEGSIARYRLRISEFRSWKSARNI
jgi:hypothetical protein